MSAPNPLCLNTCRRIGLLLMLLLAHPLASAAPAQLPMLTRDGTTGSPNIVYTIDDSGSMDWQFMPDSMFAGVVGTIYSEWDTGFHPAEAGQFPAPRVQYVTTDPTDLLAARFRSPQVNRIYYNPAIRYTPWANADGSTMGNAPPAAAPIDPMQPGLGTADLTFSGNLSANWCLWNLACAVDTRDFTPATYFEFNGGDEMNVADFQRVAISASGTYSRPGNREDCAVDPLDSSLRECTGAQELQNFANWYTYYRRRMAVAIAATSRAFAAQGDGFRLGYGSINQGTSGVDGVPTSTMIRGVRPFTGTDRDDFFTWLHSQVSGSGTPLRRAMDDVGRYFERTDDRGPWGAVPGTSDSTAHLACRKSYHILMTDGYWNSAEASTLAARANVDNQNGPSLSGPSAQTFQYTPAPPFSDSHANTLADVAMYYWNRDLRPDLANKVRPDVSDPAFWQHLVQFTVGLGVYGTLNPETDFDALVAGTLQWPEPLGSATVDDLWHAAVNARGEYLSASNPDEFDEALGSVLRTISERDAAEGGAAVSSQTLDTATRKFVPGYNTSRWSGEIVAQQLNAQGQSVGELWRASEELPAPAARNIVMGTGGTSTAVAFKWSTMTTTQRDRFGVNGSANLVDYLRGDRSLEGSTYRARKTDSVLGDFVSSTPLLVGGLLDEQYSFLPSSSTAASTYRTFLTTKQARAPLLFIGANDGMLHAFSASTGEEAFAFVPNEVVPNLHQLAAPNYQHQFYVDGPLSEADAYFDGQWNNLVLGSLGAGGRAIFAINTTDLASMGAGDVMWEVNANLGYVMSPISVGPLKDGRWAAFVGNGLDSPTGNAELLILDIKTGALIKKLTVNGGTGNGLGGVRLIRNFNNEVVGAYAGDVKGNLWRFDLSSAAPADWVVGFGNKPLFVARDSLTNRQPITAQPEYLDHPAGGQLVVFGTGKLYADADLTNTASQTLYGVWDKVPGTEAPADGEQFLSSDTLVSHTFGAISTINGTDYSNSTATAVDYTARRGWRLNLTLATGQRAIFAPLLVRGYALFSTVAPGALTVEPCDEQRSTGFNVLINALTGASSPNPVVDTNGDGVIDSGDTLASAWKTVADGHDTIQTGTNGLVVIQRANSTTSIRLEGRSLERSWRQILNYPR